MKSLFRTLLTFTILLGVSFVLPSCSRREVHYVPTNVGQPMYNGYVRQTYYPPFHSRPDPRFGYRRSVIVHHVHHFTPARRSR